MAAVTGNLPGLEQSRLISHIILTNVVINVSGSGMLLIFKLGPSSYSTGYSFKIILFQCASFNVHLNSGKPFTDFRNLD